MSDQKRFLDKDYTRRQFLKLSGKSLVGVAMSSAMLSTLGIRYAYGPSPRACWSSMPTAAWAASVAKSTAR